MTHKTPFLITSLAICLFLPASSQLQAQTSASGSLTDWSAWDGTWKPSAARHAGQALPKPQMEMMTLKMSQGKFEFSVGNFTEKGKLVIRKATGEGQPDLLDVMIEEGPNQGKTVPAIYAFEDGKLKICYGAESTVRPTDFESNAENAYLLVTYEKQTQ